jgi:hypothetical protein
MRVFAVSFWQVNERETPARRAMSDLVTDVPVRPTVLTALRTAASLAAASRCRASMALSGLGLLVVELGLEMRAAGGCRIRLGVLRLLVVGAELDEIVRAPALPPDGVEEVLVGAAEVEFLGLVE